MTKDEEIAEAIAWAESLPVLGDSPKAKLLASEVKRLQRRVQFATEKLDELIEVRR